MPFEEFELMQHPFGWKSEYWNGEAHFSPRQAHVQVRIDVKPRKPSKVCEISSLNAGDAELLSHEFFRAFRDSVEFFNWPVASIRKHAEKNIHDYFNGVRGKPLPLSAMAIDLKSKKLIGLALFVEKDDGRSELDLLFVRKTHRLRGVASQMVQTAVNTLFESGCKELWSAYHVCNEVSRSWHTNFGFTEVPDQMYIRMKYYWYRHEIWRLSKIGENDKIPELKLQEEHCYDQLDDLSKDGIQMLRMS